MNWLAWLDRHTNWPCVGLLWYIALCFYILAYLDEHHSLLLLLMIASNIHGFAWGVKHARSKGSLT
jgi:hypothetical protein